MNQRYLLIPPNIQRMMTGAAKAIIQGQKVTITYTNGTKETATLGEQDLRAGRENWFALVSAVQAKRPTLKTAAALRAQDFDNSQATTSEPCAEL